MSFIDHGSAPMLEKCAICLSKMYSDQIVTLQNCSHTFCCICISEWICEGDSSCPCCRADFSSKDRYNGFYYGMIYGIVAPIYELVIDFHNMEKSEQNNFKYNFRKAADELGDLNDILEDNCMPIFTFKQIMRALETISIDGAEAKKVFITKAKLWNKFIGYAKICEDLTNINEKPEVITFVKNFFN